MNPEPSPPAANAGPTSRRSHTRLELALLWTGLVVSDSAAQLLFKAAAVQMAEPRLDWAWLVMVAHSQRAWAAVSCLLVTFGLWMLILRRSALGMAFPVTALTFVGVIAGSRLLFGESIEPLQFAGIALIVCGVAMLRPLDR
jgi:drug/metabolite transporter (DMT)-like permease